MPPPVHWSNGIALFARAQVETRPANVNIVGFDTVEEHPPGLTVLRARDFQPPGDALAMRNEHERDRALIPPRDGRDLRPGHEPGVRPDPILIEPARDARRQWEEADVIDEHHRLSEQRVDGTFQ